MLLSDKDIAWELAYGELDVSPVELDRQLQPCSLDIRVGDEYAYYNTASNVIFDTKHSNVESYLRHEPIGEEGLLIHPDDFYIVNTKEELIIPDYLEATLRGRSSFGRLGIEVHSTAGLIDPGFGRPDGSDLVLEISNNGPNPVRIYRDQRIGQLEFKRLETPAGTAYDEKEDNKYNDQKGAVGSRIVEDFENGE